MVTKIRKWGNSLALRLPQEIVSRLNLREGSEIKIESKTNLLVVKPVKKPKIETLKKLLSQITPENSHELVDWGPPQGKEVW